MVTHPAPGNKDNTLVNALLYHTKNNLSSLHDNNRPGIVHRLDKDTSGLLVIAKNNLTHFNLASSTNGIKNKGTKETPILKLVDKCINMTDTRINNIIFDISQEVRDDTLKKVIKINHK